MSQELENSLLKEEDRAQLIHYLFDRYGITEAFWGSWDFIKRKEGLWLFPRGSYELGHQGAEESAGLRLFSGTEFPYKVTHQFGLFCQGVIKKGTIDADHESAVKLLKREVDLDFVTQETRPGYYLIQFEGKFVGVALLSRGKWTSQVPKSLKAQLPQNLSIRNLR